MSSAEWLHVARVCLCISAAVLLLASLVLLPVGLFTPAWLVQNDFGRSSVSLASSIDRHAIGVIEDCLLSDRYDQPNVCETRLTATDASDTAGSAEGWRRQVFILLLVGLLCGVEALQLSCCSVQLTAVAVVCALFAVAYAFLLLTGILVFQNAVTDQYDLSLFVSSADRLFASGSDMYSTGYSYHCVLWACGIAFGAALCALLSSLVALFIYVKRKRYNQRTLPVYRLNRMHGFDN